MTITLTPGAVSLETLAAIYWDGTPAELDRGGDPAIHWAAARIADIASGNAPVYGVNAAWQTRLDPHRSGDVATLQRNLILSHCCGIGHPLPENIVRLILSLKLISLGRGASGVRVELVRLIEAMLARGVIPVIPEKGSVGASGDLAPLAHMAAVMMGESEAVVDGRRLNGGEALAKAGLSPVVLECERGAGADQRHPDFDRAGAGRAISRAPRRAIGADHWRDVHRCRDGLVDALPPPYSHTARPQRPDRSRRQPARPAAGVGDPRQPRRGRRSVFRIPIASAASRRLMAPASTSCAVPRRPWKSRQTP